MEKIYAYFLILTLTLTPNLIAQECTETTEGTDFWFGFMEHRHWKDAHYLEIAVTSRFNCSFEVFIGDDAQSLGTFNLVANTSEKVRIPFADVEAIGSEKIEEKAVHLVSTENVNVYAMNYDALSADVAVIYPTQALGLEYYAICYEPEANPSLRGNGRNSEFLIVCPQNNTKLTITPSVDTDNGRPANQPFEITLNRGDIYQVQSYNEKIAGQGDLTGSYVESDKPVAFYSGSLAAKVPSTPGANAYDHLYEQIPPVNSWGREYVLTPTINRTVDYYRILAAGNNTIVTNSATGDTYNLDAGEFQEFTLNQQPSVIYANQPILVAQYAASNSEDVNGIGDPYMIILGATNQSKDDVTFDAYETFIQNYYVNLITQTVNKGNIVLDGVPINANVFQDIAGSEFSYAQIKLDNPGTHRLQSTNTEIGFLGYQYGLGEDDGVLDASKESYGYPIGFNLQLQLNISVNDEIRDTVRACRNESMTLEVSGRYYDFQWLQGDNSNVLNNGSTLELDGSAEGWYYAEGTTDLISGSCTTKDSILVERIDCIPEVPTELVAMGSGDPATSIEITWMDNSTSETGFIIQRRIAGGNWIDIGQTGENITVFSDPIDDDLILCDSVEYRVQAIGTGENSDWSEFYSAKVHGLNSYATGWEMFQFHIQANNDHSIGILEDGQYTFVGNNRFWESNDLQDWSPFQQLFFQGEKTGLVYEENQYIMIGHGNGNQKIMYGNGQPGNWELIYDLIGSPNNDRMVNTYFLEDILYHDGNYIIVGYDNAANSGVILTSLNGVDWNLTKTVEGTKFYSVIWTGSGYLAVGDNGIMYSSDGRISKWTSLNSGVNGNMRDIVHIGSGEFVAVGENGAIITGNGETWTQQNFGNVNFDHVYWTGDKLIATDKSTNLYISEDGQNWTIVSTNIDYDIYGLIWNGSSMVAYGDGNKVYKLYSDDCEVVPVEIDCPESLEVSCIDLIPDEPINYDAFLNTYGGIEVNPGSGVVDFRVTDNMNLITSSCNETFERVIYVEDALGESDECTHTILINDDIAPTVDPGTGVNIALSVNQCPSGGDGFPELSWDDFINNGGSFDASECSSVSVIAKLGDDQIDDSQCPFTITRQYVVEDACGNQSEAFTQVISITDAEAPNQVIVPDIELQFIEDLVLLGDSSNVASVATDGCVPSESLVITRTDDGSDIQVPDVNNPCMSTINREYTVTDICGNPTVLTQTITIEDIDLIVSLPEDLSFCSGETVDIVASVSRSDYDNIVWSPNGASATESISISTSDNIEVTVDINGCEKSDEMTVTELTKPIPSISDSVCLPLQAIITSTSKDANSWEWIADPNQQNTILQGEFEESVTIDLSNSLTSTIGLIASNQCDADITWFTLERQPNFDFTVTNTEGCQPLSISLSPNSIDEIDGLNYTWTVHDSVVGNSTEDLDITINRIGSHSVGAEASYLASDGSNCAASIVKENVIDIKPNPVASFTIDHDTISDQDPIIRLENTSSFASNYRWDFGDGNFSSEQDAVHRYEGGTQYLVKLTVYDQFGCSDSTETQVFITQLTNYAPNVFRPNSSLPENQVFLPLTKTDLIDHDSYLFMVFSRWGTLIFSSENIDEPWDGLRKNGKPFGMGNYTYRIKYADIQGNQYDLQGSVLLLE